MLGTGFNKLTPQHPRRMPLHASALRRSAQVAPNSTAIARFLLDSSDGFLHVLTPTCEVYVIPFLASRNPDLHWFKLNRVYCVTTAPVSLSPVLKFDY